MATIRVEWPQDAPGIRALNERAFGQPAEADIVGHILFSPAVVETTGRRVVGSGLAPLAVIPERQREGIGSALVERGLAILRERGCQFVIVLGHPDFYPRFGFERASAHGLACQWESARDEAFMVLILDQDAMEGVSGVARYLDEFATAV